MKVIKIVAVLILTYALKMHAQDSTRTPLNERTFADYKTAWECAPVPRWTESRFWRDKRPDTIYVARTGNPSQRTTVEKVRTCLARFDLSATAQHDIIGLMQALLGAENDEQADIATGRLLAAVKVASVPVRAWALYQITDIYLSATQPKLQRGENYIAMLDSLGAAAALERLLAHRKFAGVAQLRDSVPLWNRELTAALAASKQLVGDDRKQYADESAKVYLDIAYLKMRANDPEAAIRTIEMGRSELAPLRPSVVSYFFGKEQLYSRIGKAAIPVQATRWFNLRGDNDNYPSRGRVTLLFPITHACGGPCYVEYGILRRLNAKLGQRGLDIVLMSRTLGYYRGQLVRPDSETIDISDYINNIANLHFPLAVWQANYGRRNDGKLLVLSSPNEEAYGASYATIVGPDGNIRLILDLSRNNEAVVEDVIEELLNRPSA